VIIDSIKIDDSFAFSKNEIETNTFYSTGLINTDKTSMTLTVYSNSITTRLELEIKANHHLFIVLADTSEHMCDGNDPSSQLGNVE
jgi:hypothetical protein